MFPAPSSASSRTDESSSSPDLVFLDIQMPGLMGLEAVDAVGVEQMPLTVFVTAYDEHALRAFRARAFDCVLKPFEAAQTLTTTERAVRRLTADAAAATSDLIPSRDDLDDRLASLLADLERDRTGDARVTVWNGDSAVLLRPTEIQRATVDGNHVRVDTAGATYVSRANPTTILARVARVSELSVAA